MDSTQTPAEKPLRRALIAALGGSAVAALVVLAFVWPTSTLEPRHIPISVSGPEQAVSALEDHLSEQRPDAFEIVAAASRDEAVTQIEQRTSYGAIILGGKGAPTEVLTAPPASPQVSQLLSGLAQQMQAELTQQLAAAGMDPTSAKITVTPVVTLSESDPTGAGLATVAFPLVFAGTIGGSFDLRPDPAPQPIGLLPTFAAASAAIMVGILQGWFGFLQGNAWLNMLALGLGIGATSTFIAALAHLFGRVGMSLGIAFGLLVANPIASASTPWQFIATPWGEIGQYLIPGATNHLLRTLSYFPNADWAVQLWTLVAWLGAAVFVLAIPRSTA